MGSRLLKRWIHQPIRNIEKLQCRQQHIQMLLQQNLVEELQPFLRQVGDMELFLLGLFLRSCSTSRFNATTNSVGTNTFYSTPPTKIPQSLVAFSQ